MERAKYWVSKGAQPSETVASFIKKATQGGGRAARVSAARAMQAFLEYVVKGLVEHPEEVTVTPVERQGMTIYELRMNPRGCGQGHRATGQDHQRHPLAAAGRQRPERLRCSLEIVEDRPCRDADGSSRAARQNAFRADA